MNCNISSICSNVLSVINGVSFGACAGCCGAIAIEAYTEDLVESALLPAAISISPETGCIFGATYMTIFSIVQPIFDSWANGPGSTDNARYISFFASIFVASVTTKVLLEATCGIVLSSASVLLLAGISTIVGAGLLLQILAWNGIGCNCLSCCLSNNINLDMPSDSFSRGCIYREMSCLGRLPDH